MKKNENVRRNKMITKKDFKPIKKKNKAVKGDYGRVLIIGGSIDFVGAPYLAGMAALRTGSDWVTIISPEKVAWSINSLSSDLITYKLESEFIDFKHRKEILTISKNFDVVLIGPGLGLENSSLKLARYLMHKIEIPKVIDADALKHIKLQECDNCVLTPNQNEFELILKHSKLKQADILPKIKNNVLIRKGQKDEIYCKNKILTTSTGTSRMIVAGTGDVLSGMIASYIGQGLSLLQSTINSSYRIGKLSESIENKGNKNFIATDLIEEMKII